MGGTGVPEQHSGEGERAYIKRVARDFPHIGFDTAYKSGTFTDKSEMHLFRTKRAEATENAASNPNGAPSLEGSGPAILILVGVFWGAALLTPSTESKRLPDLPPGYTPESLLRIPLPDNMPYKPAEKLAPTKTTQNPVPSPTPPTKPAPSAQLPKTAPVTPTPTLSPEQESYFKNLPIPEGSIYPPPTATRPTPKQHMAAVPTPAQTAKPAFEMSADHPRIVPKLALHQAERITSPTNAYPLRITTLSGAGNPIDNRLVCPSGTTSGEIVLEASFVRNKFSSPYARDFSAVSGYNPQLYTYTFLKAGDTLSRGTWTLTTGDKNTLVCSGLYEISPTPQPQP